MLHGNTLSRALFQYLYLLVFKSKIVSSMRANGYIQPETMTLVQLHRFWYKRYQLR